MEQRGFVNHSHPSANPSATTDFSKLLRFLQQCPLSKMGIVIYVALEFIFVGFTSSYQKQGPVTLDSFQFSTSSQFLQIPALYNCFLVTTFLSDNETQPTGLAILALPHSWPVWRCHSDDLSVTASIHVALCLLFSNHQLELPPRTFSLRDTLDSNKGFSPLVTRSFFLAPPSLAECMRGDFPSSFCSCKFQPSLLSRTRE